MKRITLFLLVSSLILCPTQNILAQKAVITGKITNNRVEEIKIYNKDNCFKATVDSSGSFKLIVEPSEGDFYNYEGNESATLYITLGDSIHIELDAEYFDETLKFSGKGEAVNNYIITNLIIDELIFEGSTPQIFAKSTDVFLLHMQYVKKYFNHRLINLQNNNRDLDKNLINHLQKNLDFNYAKRLMEYPVKYKEITGKEALNIGNDYYSFLSEIDLSNPEHLKIKEYKPLLERVVEHKVKIALKTDPSLKDISFAETYAIIKVISENFANSEIQNALLKDKMCYQFSEIKADEKILAILAKKLEPKDYKKLENVYQNLKYLTKGNKGPVCEFVDTLGNKFNLSDFTGKYVYIDVWSTTCNPCIREFPNFEKLKKDYSNKNIIFLSVCFDKGEGWKNMIKSKDLTGIQLHAIDGWKSTFRYHYLKWHGVPCCILLDKEGKIIDARAPKPSGNIRDVLDNLAGI